MQISELVIATPYYVLMDQKTPFGPSVADPIRDVEYSAIFGFSDKASYDSFCRESSRIANALSASQRLFAKSAWRTWP